MATTVRSHGLDPNLMTSRMFAQVFQAYLECSEEVQAAIREMTGIVNDPEASEDERFMACTTIAEAFFPSRHDGHLGVDLEATERLDARTSPEVRGIQAEMERQETHFAQRVEALLKAKGMTQSELAAACGMGQSAVSNLLARRSRPQQRTVEKFARAFSIHPSELWPDRS